MKKNLGFLLALFLAGAISPAAFASQPFKVKCVDSQGVVLNFVGRSGVLRDHQGSLRKIDDANTLLYPGNNGGLSEIFVQGYRDIREDELQQMSCTYQNEVEAAAKRPTRQKAVRAGGQEEEPCYHLAFLGQCYRGKDW